MLGLRALIAGCLIVADRRKPLTDLIGMPEHVVHGDLSIGEVTGVTHPIHRHALFAPKRHSGLAAAEEISQAGRAARLLIKPPM